MEGMRKGQKKRTREWERMGRRALGELLEVIKFDL